MTLGPLLVFWGDEVASKCSKKESVPGRGLWGVSKSADLRGGHCNFSLDGDGLVTKSCLTLATPWVVARQAPLSMGFSRQEYCSGLPFPSLSDLPKLGIETRSPALQADSLPSEPNPMDCKEIKPVNPKGT